MLPSMGTEQAEYIGVSELAAAVGEELAEIRDFDRRMKSGATEIPTQRTIRFYLEKGLLPKPSKRLGQTLVFGRVHLLHLLVIKKLQADGVPLSAIPDVLKKKGKTEAQLEELLKQDVQTFRNRRSLDEYRQRTGHTDDSDLVVSFARAADPPRQDIFTASPRQEFDEEPQGERLPEGERPHASGAKSYLKSLLSRSPKPAARPPVQREAEEPLPDVLFSMSSSYDLPEPTALWSRHEPARGLEVNISRDYEPPSDEQAKAKLLEKLRNILGL